MRNLFLIFFFLGGALVTAKGADPITQQIILAEQWRPTDLETKNALAAAIARVQQVARDPDDFSEPISKSHNARIISQNLAKYAVQFIGEVKNGKKIIYCNFFPAADIEHELSYWKKSQIIVMDGGADF